MMATLTRFAAHFAVALTISMLAACSGESSGPEEQVRAWVDAMHRAAEAKERGEIVDRISPAYVDARDNSRDDIENMLRVYFLRQNSISILPSIDSIEIIGDTVAEVALTVGMAGTNDSVLGISADAYAFELELELDGDEWKLISARWGELGKQLR